MIHSIDGPLWVDKKSLKTANVVIATMNPKVYQFFLSKFAVCGSFLNGYDLGVIASVLEADGFKAKFLTSNATALAGTIVALFTSGELSGHDARYRN